MRDAEYIRVFLEFGISKRALAREYEVCLDTIRSIASHRSFNPGAPPPNYNQHRKLDVSQVQEIRRLRALGYGEQRIAKALGGVITRSTVRQVIDGKTYRDVT